MGFSIIGYSFKNNAGIFSILNLKNFFSGEEVLEIKDTKYPCIILERIANNRKTHYYVAKTLDFILIKVEDNRKERMLSIEAEKILSFG